MGVTDFIEKISSIVNDEEAFAKRLFDANDEDRTAILKDISVTLKGLISQLESEKKIDGIVTIKAYCDVRKVSRQYVYQEIKSGKFKTIELPVYAEYNGTKVEVGTQKFLQF